ncbi:MAG: ABC transporter ATP-binding protein [Jannaschia sp.]
MIVLKDLTKVFRLEGTRNIVADRINAVFPTGQSVGLLGRNGAGKSTLLKLIAGTTHPTSGEIFSTGRISFPVGLASSLHLDMSGAQNTRFVARIYGADSAELARYVEDFAELGDHYHLPVRSYSSGMRGRLSFGINMGLKFDTYLVDEITAVGDATFKRKARDVFLARMETSDAIFVSHSMGLVREYCSAAAILENGHLTYYDDVEEGIDRYLYSLDTNTSASAAPIWDPTIMSFPRDARMVFGLGVAGTRTDWVADCMRRHRGCLFPPMREPHYFDIRAGLSPGLTRRRFETARRLAEQMLTEEGEARGQTVRLLGETSDLLRIHAAPMTGPDRHTAYTELLLARRKSHPIVCDFTPDYFLLDRADFAEMAGIGSALFVVVLRDPVSRYLADIWGRLPANRRSADVLATAVARRMNADGGVTSLPHSDYVRTLDALEDAVPRERILYLVHEALTDRMSLQPLFDFVDLPPLAEIKLPPLVPDEAVPAIPTALRNDLRNALAPHYDAAARRFGGQLPEGWMPAVVPRVAGRRAAE